MYEFVTFERFITQDILIVCYYIGVLAMPYVVYYLLYKKKLFLHVKQITNNKRVIILLIVFFLLAQLVWRMMFEAMIGYFDMHDYLQQLLQHKG